MSRCRPAGPPQDGAPGDDVVSRDQEAHAGGEEAVEDHAADEGGAEWARMGAPAAAALPRADAPPHAQEAEELGADAP